MHRFNTGDVLSMDENGMLYFGSRSKEIIAGKGSSNANFVI